MPSEALKDLVAELQALAEDQFHLNSEYSRQELELAELENKLRKASKSDSGLSQGVIELRKQITLGRTKLKDLSVARAKNQEVWSQVSD